MQIGCKHIDLSDLPQLGIRQLQYKTNLNGASEVLNWAVPKV